MSNAAIDWACAQDLPSSQKFVLVILSNRANAANECFPSIASLSQDTGLDRKIVIKSLDRLQDAGLLEDTGLRRGKTNQIKVYRLKRHSGKSSRNGTVPHPEQFHISPERVPDVEHGTQRNPKYEERERRPRGEGAKMQPDELHLGPSDKPLTSSRRCEAIPKNVDAVIEKGKMIGVSEQDCRDWYRDREACGWCRGDGSPISNWAWQLIQFRDDVRGQATKAHTVRPSTNAKSPGASVWEIAKAIEIIEEQAKVMKNQYCNDGGLGCNWSSQSKREEHRKLVQEAKRLKGTIPESVRKRV